jgi:cellulose synthase/poly-beta-1,6-N-acetylglucosamine synthase-like glycosyltransferase
MQAAYRQSKSTMKNVFITVLAGLDVRTILSMFWFLILFEGPRLVIGNIVTAIELMIRQKPLTTDRLPAASVIIACHNGARGLSRTIASLREQTLGRFEIIVVDDGSVDRTTAIASALQDVGACDIVLSCRFRGGKSSALNLGLCYCTNPVVVCVDSDTTFDRDGLLQIVAEFQDPKVGAAGGNIGIRNHDGSLLAAMQAVEYTIGISLGRRIGTLLGIVPIASGAFCAFRREALHAVGGWEAGPGEDADLTSKLRQAGWRVNFVSSANALTDAPTSLPALISQRLRWDSDLLRLYARKFQSCLFPFSSMFLLRNALGMIDVLVFSFGMSFVFLAYVIWLTATYGKQSLSIMFVSALIYAVIGVLNFIVGVALSATPHRARLLPYALGYGVYSLCVLQPIRMWAVIGELVFRRSLRPGFVPTKVINHVRSA